MDTLNKLLKIRRLFSGKPREKREKKVRSVSLRREYFELIVETLVFVFFVMTFLLQSFVIPTGSMEDTLLIGDHLFVDKVAYSRSLGWMDRLVFPQTDIQRGMIVTFKAPHEMDKEYVKRVIGLPGETLQVIDKKVYINGKLLDEPYVFFKGGYGTIDNFPPVYPASWYEDYVGNVIFPPALRQSVIDTPLGKAFVIPQGTYFCMGDNRDHSLDCRYWGPVPADYIIGKPWRIYLSTKATRDDYIATSVVEKMKNMLARIVGIVSGTRWQRTLMKVS